MRPKHRPPWLHPPLSAAEAAAASAISWSAMKSCKSSGMASLGAGPNFLPLRVKVAVHS